MIVRNTCHYFPPILNEYSGFIISLMDLKVNKKPLCVNKGVLRISVGLLNFFELVFSSAAIRANPICGKIIKGCTRFDSLRGITLGRVVDVSTGDAFVF